MARLPKPGGDNGNWGDILNDYLSQTHNPDGTLKDNSVGSAQIADGSLTETLLDAGVQTKLNQITPTWSTLSGRPSVIGAGNDAAAARNAIGLDDGSGKIPSTLIPPVHTDDISGLSDRLAALSSADAYIDFTTKADGDPPAFLDTGQAVDFVSENQSNWKPQIANGELVHGSLPGSGPYAAYYQAQLNGDCYKAGARWVVDSNDGSTNGSMCLAAWSSIYGPPGDTVPKSPYHVTVNTLSPTNNVQFWVTDGGGSGSDHLKSIKSWTCSVPNSDGIEEWELSVHIDPASGTATFKLPGVESVSGSRYVSITEAEVNEVLNGFYGLPPVTFDQLLKGADVLIIEHYAPNNAQTSVYPRFLDMWGDILRPARNASNEIESHATVATSSLSTYVHYSPATAVNTTVPNTLTAIPGLSPLTFTLPLGCSAVEVEATLYYTVTTGPSRIIMNFSEGLTGFDTRTVLNTAPFVGEVRYTGYRNNLMPGSTHTFVLNHMVASGTGATLNCDGPNGYVASWKVTPVVAS